MSFSSRVKNELCRIEIPQPCCLNAELAAVIAINGTVRIHENDNVDIQIITENAAFARKVFSLIKKVYYIYPQVVIRRNRKLKKHIAYIVNISSSTNAVKVLEGIGISAFKNSIEGTDRMVRQSILKKACCRKAYLRGAFLSGGSISDPEKTYHMEITCHSEELAVEIKKIMDGFHLHAKIIGRKGNFVLYLKEGENIVDLLNIIGAHSALMEVENIRILKGMRNSVNRIVNCETANLQKTVDASIRQIENIEYIRDFIGFENLPENLKEIAELRLAYRDASLKELGEMLTPALGKSGVNHRLRKLDAIAEQARGLKGE